MRREHFLELDVCWGHEWWGETPSSPNLYSLEIRARRSLAPPGSWKASIRFCARIGTMNHPSPDLRLPSPHRMGRGNGWGSWKDERVRGLRKSCGPDWIWS